MRLWVIVISLMLLGCGDKHVFSPNSASYQLSTCHQMGAPEQISLKEGKFSYGRVQSNGEHQMEIAISQSFSGKTVESNLPFTLVELSCQQWGANYTDYEWFIFSADGEQVAKLDENDFIDRYTKVSSDPVIWFSNAIPAHFGDMVSVEGAKLQFRFAAGGRHAAPDSVVSFSYQMTDRGLQSMGQPQIEKYQ